MGGEEVNAAAGGGGGGLTLGWGMGGGGGGGGRGSSCDSCNSPAASFYRRSDSAFFLCAACDSRGLGRPHSSAALCDVCERAPAHVTCKADDAALCAACDRDIHSANPLASRHERVPIASAPVRLDYGSEDAAEAEAATWILPDLKPAGSGSPDMELTRYSFETDPYLDLDYPPTDAKFDVSAAPASDCVVPVQSKTEAAAAVVVCTAIPESRLELDFGGSKYNSHTVPCSSSVESGVVPDSTTAIGGGAGCVSSANRTVVQITGADCEARVLRYREKRKTRKFEKTIRYASRKAYAETRPRIKGRFAKRVDMEADVDRMYGSPDALSADAGYGVVPSF